MSKILNYPYNDVVDVVFPQDFPWGGTLNQSPLVVQLSHFDCGGIAVSACLLHKIADGYSFSRFLNDWAAIARKLDFEPSPQFNASSLFPLMDDALDISNEVVQNPTRVEVATTLLLKCGVVVSMEKSDAFKPILWSLVMNIRPLVPFNTIGNAFLLLGSITMTEDKVEMSSGAPEPESKLNMPPRRANTFKNNHQPPQPADSLNEKVSNAEFRAAF
ncbi:hypothetical protein BC332_28883 [Capsicum chinense]|nr:hypothetical protein BC332_28883 [Capsicum chinense]